MTADVITLIVTVFTVFFSWYIMSGGFDNHDHRYLTVQRRCSRVIVVLTVFGFMLSPVAALTFAPEDGLQLAVTMTIGAIQVVVLAMQFAILHHIWVAEEARS